MQNSSDRKASIGLLFTLFFLSLVTALVLIPTQFQTEAVSAGKGLFPRTTSDDPSLPNYDIRIEKSEETGNFLSSARESVAKDASAVASAA